MARKINTGDCFEPGQVWMTPRGTLWRVMGYEWPPLGRKKAIIRMGTNGKGRKQKRDWDAVIEWVIYAHADGSPSACVLAATLSERYLVLPNVRAERPATAGEKV